MKLLSIFFALAIYAFTLVQSFNIPEPNVKCTMDCDLQEYKPICASDDSGLTKTYRNVCVLKSENCISSKSFQKIDDRECP